jgi:hypothetical protein
MSIWSGVLFTSLIGSPPAQADVTGSYDGTLTSKQSTEAIAAAAVFAQSGKAVTGTVALPGDLTTFGGEYLVTGTATPKKLKISDIGVNAVSFKYRGKIAAGTIRGKAKLKGPGGKLRATLAMTLNVSTGDGSSCDGVYTANQTFFVNEMMVQALTSCATCHNPGLQAGATRLHINSGDPLATARQIALLIDSVSPSTSLILEKPLNVLPHGGGQQIFSGSTQEQLLAQWADLIAVGACN